MTCSFAAGPRSGPVYLPVARGRARIDSSELVEPLLKEIAFDLVGGEYQRFGVGQAGIAGAVQAAQELAPRGGQVVVAGQLRLAGQLVEGIQPGLRSVGFAERDGAVERDYRRGPDFDQHVVE